MVRKGGLALDEGRARMAHAAGRMDGGGTGPSTGTDLAPILIPATEQELGACIFHFAGF
jgi:hypothetical protein